MYIFYQFASWAVYFKMTLDAKFVCGNYKNGSSVMIILRNNGNVMERARNSQVTFKHGTRSDYYTISPYTCRAMTLTQSIPMHPIRPRLQRTQQCLCNIYSVVLMFPSTNSGPSPISSSFRQSHPSSQHVAPQNS